MRRVAGGHAPGQALPCWKYPALLKLLTEGDLTNQQVVVYFSFKEELRRAWLDLQEADVSATWVTGDLDLDERAIRIHRFQNSERRVLLISLACGKFGLNLSCSDAAIYFSGTWSFETRRQSEDRLSLSNKKADLLYIDLITEDTADEDVAEACKVRAASSSFFLSKVKARHENQAHRPPINPDD
jgi:SNF2 family DNA or RNA helicase